VFGVDMKIVDAAWPTNRPGRRGSAASGWCAGVGDQRLFRDAAGSAAAFDGAGSGPAPGASCTIDPDGFLKVVDRRKDVIQSGGEWLTRSTSRKK